MVFTTHMTDYVSMDQRHKCSVSNCMCSLSCRPESRNFLVELVTWLLFCSSSAMGGVVQYDEFFSQVLLVVSRTTSGHHEAADRCHGSGDQHDPGPAAGGLQGSESDLASMHKRCVC